MGRWLVTALLSFLIIFTAGCEGSDGPVASDDPGGSNDTAGYEETTTPEGDRPEGAKGKGEGLDAEMVPRAVAAGRTYTLAGYGEGSLWATDQASCNDTSGLSETDFSSAACAGPPETLLKRLDSRTGEAVAEIPLEGFAPPIAEVVFGAGSVWVSSGKSYPSPPGGSPGDIVLRIDPQTNEVVGRIPVASPAGLAFGFGSVWVTNARGGTVSRIDPATGEVAAEIEVGTQGAADVAVDEESGAVWVGSHPLAQEPGPGLEGPPSGDRKLTRVDPETNRVVAEVPIEDGETIGGVESVAVGEEAVWAASGNGKLYRVDPETNEVAAIVPLGDYTKDLLVSGGAVWATVQASGEASSSGGSEATPSGGPGGASPQDSLKRVDPKTNEVVGSIDLGPLEASNYGRLASGGDYVWFVSGAETGEGALMRIAL